MLFFALLGRLHRVLPGRLRLDQRSKKKAAQRAEYDESLKDWARSQGRVAKPCPQCHSDVHRDAAICPSCGFKFC